MIRRVFSILIAIAVLGIASGGGGGGIAQAASGFVKIIERRLPDADISVTGIGFPPRRKGSPSQKRLLAKRAATVDAYRVLAATLNGVSGYIKGGGEGCIQISGYIKGAAVTEIREFADGKVEVNLSLPITFVGKKVGEKITWDKIIADINRKGYPVYYLRKPEKQISEKEWLEITEKEG